MEILSPSEQEQEQLFHDALRLIDRAMAPETPAWQRTMLLDHALGLWRAAQAYRKGWRQ